MAEASADWQRVPYRLYDELRYTLGPENVTAKVHQWQVSSMITQSFQSAFQGHWGMVLGASLLLTFLLTYITTYLKSSLAIRRQKIWRQPPIMPYWIPFFGNLLPYLWDPSGFCWKTTKKYGYAMPIRVRLGPLKIYLVSGADHYLALFSSKASRCMNTKAAVLLALENLFGTPSNVIPFYAADNSGVNSTPVPWSRVKPEHRITYLQTRAAHKHLSGPGLAQMTGFFLNVLKQRFQSSQIRSEWVDHPDLYRFLQNEVFRAAVEAMCGQHLLAQSPTFVDDFWEFVDAVPILIKGFPRWLSPKPYRVRGRLLDAIKRWHSLAHEKSDCIKTGANDPEWDPYFGSKLMRARQEYSRSMPFMNADALAAEDLGLLFATNTNAIPSLTWFIFEICRDPDLLSRVEKDVEACRTRSSSTDKIDLDIDKLCSRPLLQSIYAETLRLRVALFVTRTPENEDFSLGDWKFPPNETIVLSSRTGAMNPDIWNAGGPDNPHPLDTFWADRFLIYPNDPMSGPLRKDVVPVKEHHSETITEEKPLETEPSFSMEGVAGGWIPYGGGQRMCPGRHFAKQEIIGTLALLLTQYEIELREPKNGVPECDMRFFPFGGLPPTEEMPFCLRKRNI